MNTEPIDELMAEPKTMKELRERSPQCAAVIDDLQKIFGTVHVRYVREGGVEIDKREKK